jgi:lysophospholipase L1-like esterase
MIVRVVAGGGLMKMTLNAWFANAALVAASSVIALVTAELALVWLDRPPGFGRLTEALEELDSRQWADWWVFDPELGTRFDRSAITPETMTRLLAVTPNWARLSVINAMGYHDHDEFKPLPAAVTRRILFVGDSFTWGASAGLGESFVELVEKRLARNGSVAVWNAAIPASGTNQAVAVSRRLTPLMDANLVILGLYENDLTDNVYPLGSNLRTRSGIAIGQYRFEAKTGNVAKLEPHEIRDRLMRRVTARESGVYGWLRTAAMIRNAATGAARPRLRDVSGEKLDATHRYLRELALDCAANGATLHVLLIPSRGTVEFGPSPEYRALESLLRDLSIEPIAPLQALTRDDYQRAPDTHWNRSGHALAANALLEVLDRGTSGGAAALAP